MHDKHDAAHILSKFFFDPWNMMGDRHKSIRRDLILAITGEKRPMAKCGVQSIIWELSKIIDLSSATCGAVYPEIFAAWFGMPDKTRRALQGKLARLA